LRIHVAIEFLQALKRVCRNPKVQERQRRILPEEIALREEPIMDKSIVSLSPSR
jgi:hypothetical protein